MHDTVSASRALMVATDDVELSRALHDALRAEDLAVVDDADDASVIVVSLHGYGAPEVVAKLRDESDAYMLGLLDVCVDGVDVLDAGADDFVRMPCPAREIAAKVRTALRRMHPRSRDREALRYEGLSIDPIAREVTVGGDVVGLPAREFDVLCFLASSPRRVFNRSELLHEVWHASDEWLGPKTVTEHVRRLRQRIEVDPAHPRWIRTVRGAGYRFDPGGP
jgi:DNA-binding response OmpR family regulator